ncbi:GNAT family N-acetyltransferase [Methanolapillus millepedarum]|uniref:N-acetyltransferase domain-containing protein n=1 Tax=Methanolapillus millepedarum TaxID=3028296 RepID=A0AA96V3X4_9EURY|nr:hypothetical protein MsAc7_16990 [Methanosarcinaceae archaeon Ac7]
MPVKLTKIKMKDQCAEISALAREIWTEHYTPIIGAKQVEYMLDKFQSAEKIYSDILNGYVYYAACDGGRFVGYMGLCPDSKGIFISKFYVRKDMRGKGIGKMFFKQAHIESRRLIPRNPVHQTIEAPCFWLTVNKNNTSIEAYKKLGFEISGEVVTDIGNGFVMDDYVMTCPIRI